MPHILLVDDDPICLAALAQRLRFGFREQRLEVDVADSAAAALILAHIHHYDALIVDLIMPGVTIPTEISAQHRCAFGKRHHDSICTELAWDLYRDGGNGI